MQKRFSGIVVPMITPLNKDLTVDVEAIERIMKLFYQSGIHPLLLGTTGESSSISATESYRFVEAAVSPHARDQVGVVPDPALQLVVPGDPFARLPGLL